MFKRNLRPTTMECPKNLCKTFILPILTSGSTPICRIVGTTWKSSEICDNLDGIYKANLLETKIFPIPLYVQLTELLLSRFFQGYYDVQNEKFLVFHPPNRQTRYSQYTHFVVTLITKNLCETFFRCVFKLLDRLPTTAQFFEELGLKPR